MKYNLNINQYAVFNNPEFSCLTLQDLVVFDFVKDFANSSACKRNSDGYFWIKHTIVSDALPILGVFNEESQSRKDICRAKIAQIMRKLCKVGLLSASPDNEAKGISEYGFGANYDKMIFAKDAQKNSDPSKNLLPPYQNSTTPPSKNLLPYNSNKDIIDKTNKLSIPIIDKSIIEIQPSCDKSHLGWQKVKFNNIYDIKELCSKWLGTDAILQYEGMLSLDLESKSKSKNLSTEEYFAKIYNMSFQAEKSVLNTEGKAKRAASVFSSISANTELFQCYSTYVTFFEKETGGILKHSTSDYSILQDIIAYLRKISTSKVFSAIKSFEAILNNLPKFFKSTANLKLFKLSQNLEAIVSQIKANANVPKALPTLSPADAKEEAIKTLAEIGLTDEMIGFIQSARCTDLQTAKNLTISQLFKAGKFDAANGERFNQCLKVLRPMLR